MTYPADAINKAFELLPIKMDTPAARAQLAAIGFQETSYLTRLQYNKGPARSYWQFELIAIKDVMLRAGTVRLAISVCDARGVEFNSQAIHKAMETDDVLGAAFARLNMWNDTGKLPTTMAEGWDMYARTWRPGKPHPSKWPESWAFGQKPLC